MLPLVLMIVVLLSMLSLSFAFTMQSDLAGAENASEGLRLRLAAQSGVEYAINMLRQDRADMERWYDNIEELKGHLVWSSSDRGVASFGAVEDLEPGEKIYRFTLVGDDPLDDETLIRYGLTDEASKFNIRLTDGMDKERFAKQLTILFEEVIPEGLDQPVDVPELVDALIDWQDKDSETRENGVETDYYEQLDPPYYAQNRALSTVEELLLVRGFTGEVLYGDDVNRNGLLDPNEDDGEDSFPPDNGDGLFDRGLLAYVTVYSADLNSGNDNRARVFLGDPKAAEKLANDFSEDEITDILTAYRTRQGGNRPNQGGSNRGGSNRGGQNNNGQNNNGQNNGGGNQQQQPPRTPADLYVQLDSEDEFSLNLDLDLLPLLMDRTTVVPVVATPGLINVGTAPDPVLRTILEFAGDTEEEAEQDLVSEIVARRASMDFESLRTTAWLVSSGALTLAEYQRVAPYLTARGQQFTIESIGHADHTGMIYRLQTVVEMKGKLSQVLYHRNLTRLGMAYPLRADEGDRGFAGRRR